MRKGRDAISKRLGHRIEGPKPIYTREFRDKLRRMHRTKSWSQIADQLNKEDEKAASGEPRTGPRVSAAARGGKRLYEMSLIFEYLWWWRTRLPERCMKPCAVICSHQPTNSVMVKFTDGFLVNTSRYAVRKVDNLGELRID